MKLTAILSMMFYIASCQPCYSAVHGSRTVNKAAILAAIVHEESRGDSQAINRAENAVGLLQIRPIMVAECNRILKKQGSPVRYTTDDRWTPERSIEMFTIYTNHYTPCWTPELVARRWNGGPAGERKQSTLKYWEKVEKKL